MPVHLPVLSHALKHGAGPRCACPGLSEARQAGATSRSGQDGSLTHAQAQNRRAPVRACTGPQGCVCQCVCVQVSWLIMQIFFH